MANDREMNVSSSRESGRGGRSLRDVMTSNPETIRGGEGLQKAARMMMDCDCGALPVVDDSGTLRGMVTDRDIVVRCVAEGRNPLEGKVQDVMTPNVHAVRENDSLDQVFRIMSEHQIRRVPVCDESGKVIGIVAQADLALDTSDDREVGRTVERISEPERERERPR